MSTFSKGFAKVKEISQKAAKEVAKKELPMRPPDVNHTQWYEMMKKKGIKL